MALWKREGTLLVLVDLRPDLGLAILTIREPVSQPIADVYNVAPARIRMSERELFSAVILN